MSKFQTRHYVAIAEVMSDMHNESTKWEIIERLIDRFKADNIHFKESKFVEACKL